MHGFAYLRGLARVLIFALAAKAVPGAAQEVALVGDLIRLGLTEESPLGDVIAAARSGTSVFIIDGFARELIAFDLESGDARTLMRRGEGPRELTNPRGLWLSGDTIFVYDSGGPKVVGVSSEGVLLSEIPVRVPLPIGDVQALGTSEWLLEPTFRLTSNETGLPGRDTLSYYLTDRSFSAPRLLTVVPGIASDRVRVGGRTFHRLAPFSPFPVAQTWGKCAIVGVTDEPEIRVFRPGVASADVVPLPESNRLPVNRSLEQAFLEDQLLRISPEGRDAFRAAARDLSFPHLLPGYITFLVDPRGLLWMQTYDPFEYSSLWVVQDFAGEVIAEIRLPVELNVHQIGEDFLLGSGTDQYGRPFVGLIDLEVSMDPTIEPLAGC